MLNRFIAIAVILIFLCLPGSTTYADEAATGLSSEKREEVTKKVEPVLKGEPVTELDPEDRALLFLAEILFPDSYNLFFRHGEYLANEKADYTQAIPRLKKALDLKPKDLKTLELLATCHYALKEAADELSCWETLREILEDHDSAEADGLRKRVMLHLERMAHENSMLMRSGKRFLVYTPAAGSYNYVADELTDKRLEEAYRQVTGDLNCIPAFRTSIIVLPPEDFEEIQPTSWAGGFAKSDKSMVLNAESFPKSSPESILPAIGIVLHEYTHNIVFLAAKGRCPTWLNEGLAVYSQNKNRDFTEFTPGGFLPHEIMTLEELEEEFREIATLGKEQIARVHKAYELAGLYARFLIQSFTLAAPRQILSGLKGGIPFPELLMSISEMTVPQFEKRFKNWVNEMGN
jgi:tetratricopeptide (TPR) repeat protein